MTVENQITESGKHHEKEPESDMKGGNNQTENVDQIEQWHNRRNQYKSEHTSNPEQEPCDNEEEDEDIPENEEDSICRTNKYKVFATSFLLLIGHQIGWETGIIGPTLIDMKDRYQTDYEHLSLAIMWRPLAAIPGGYLGGVLCDWYRPKLFLFIGIFLSLAGIVTICIPYGGNIVNLTVLYALQGFLHASTVIGSKALIIAIWDQKCVIPLHWQLASKSLGQIFAGLMVRSFLTPRNQNPPLNSTKDILNTCNFTSNIYNSTSVNNRIDIPYVIVGMVGFLSSAAFFVMAFYNCKQDFTLPPGKRKGSIKSYWSLESFKKGRILIMTVLTVVLFIAYMVLAIQEVTLSNFLLAVAVESQLHFSSSNAAIVHTTHYIGRFAGRLLYGIVTNIITLKAATSLAVGLLITFGAVMCFAGLEYSYVFWVSVPLHAFFVGPMGPIILAFTNMFVPVKGILLAIIHTGTTIGAMISLAVGGAIFQKSGPWTLLFFAFSMSIVLAISVAVVFILGKKHKDHMTKDLNNNNIDNEKEQLIK